MAGSMEYGLIGERLGHSYSVPIHNQLADYSYVLREVAPEELDAFMRGHDFRGINVTIPYKKAVMPYCAELSDAAREVGCVNTIVTRPDGSLYGHNTDIGGFIHMLRSAGIDPAGRKAVVLGSGGTSLTARAALRRLNAREIIVVSRSGPVDYEALYREHADCEILVNTTPVGMYPKTGASPVDMERLPNLRGVADVIYNPERTALIIDAMERGIPAVSGLSMLVAQAREAAELFAGHDIPMEMVNKVCARIHSDTLNLVLVGMPGCGKSTMGRRLAAAMGREFVDCDDEIERRAGMTIPEIFARHGETYFRDLESSVLAEVCRGARLVVATGGGAVIRPENRRAMGQNGRVCFIRRDVAALARKGRPLSASDDAVARLWDERRALYAQAADFTVNNDRPVDEVAGSIREAFYEAVGN
jgi:shikimate dehydrogenase